MTKIQRLILSSAFLAFTPFLTAASATAQSSDARVTKSSYGVTSTGEPVDQYTLTNTNGMEVSIITYGAIVTSIIPGSNMPNIALGFSTLKDYETQNSPGPHFGALIGRYANRIANGVFTLNGVTYCLDANNGVNSLHGGFKGFDTKLWTVEKVINQTSEVGVELHYLSPAGDGWTDTAPNPNCPANAKFGFPGNLDTFVTYTLNNQNQLIISYKATTDAPTVVNLTNHTYWNLSGEGTGTVYQDIVTLHANQFTPGNSMQIPTGAILPVAGTVLDFRQPTAIAKNIRVNDPQLVSGSGFDNNWVISASASQTGLPLAATVFDPSSKRTLNVYTNQPGIQFYTGNSLNGTNYGTSNRAYRQSDGFALETQHYPDSPNHPNFPTTTLLPGKTYSTTTIFEILNGN
jgi:aldose 1-epimerase